MDFPILQPVCIPTKGKSLLVRIWIFLTCTRTWRVVEDWVFRTKINGTPVDILIPKDFIFDGASIPRWLWWLLPPMDVLLIPSLVHDYAYRHQNIILLSQSRSAKRVKLCRSKRLFWDKLFRDISIQVNGCKVISYFSWAMLCLFGSFAWNKNRKLEAKTIAEDWKKLKDFEERSRNF